MSSNNIKLSIFLLSVRGIGILRFSYMLLPSREAFDWSWVFQCQFDGYLSIFGP